MLRLILIEDPILLAVMDILAYVKPKCCRTRALVYVFEKYGLSFEAKDIANDPDAYAEMLERAGEGYAPCVIIDEVLLAGTNADEVEAYLLENQLVAPKEDYKEAPPKSCGCASKNKNASDAHSASVQAGEAIAFVEDDDDDEQVRSETVRLF